MSTFRSQSRREYSSAASDDPRDRRFSDASVQCEPTSLLSRRLRRLDGLDMLGRAGGGGRTFRFFFPSAAPPIFSYYAYIAVVDLPDVIDAASDEIDFLFARREQHAELLVAAGLLACGASLGRIATRAAVENARKTYGAFAAWILLRPGSVKAATAVALPDREAAYAMGHGACRVFAAQHQPAFDRWVDAICTRPRRNVLIDTSAASAAYREAREQFRRWEALDAAHQT